MKSSPSFTLQVLILVASILLAASWMQFSQAIPQEASLMHLCSHHQHHHHRQAVISSSLQRPPSWCLQFPRGMLQPPPQPPPPQDEIDPRYGVEKRLVPTGPNPLHN